MNVNDKYIDLLPDIYKRSYLEYRKGLFHVEGWGSHQPVIIHVLNTVTVGKVLEFGMGYNSTPIFHTICKAQKRNLISVDFDFTWYKRFTGYKSDSHKILFMNQDLFRNKERSFIPLNNNYSIVFVDSRPAWTRTMLIELVKDRADYIIAHDTTNYINGKQDGYGYDFSGFKHVYHFTKVSVATTLVSNLTEINPGILKIF